VREGCGELDVASWATVSLGFHGEVSRFHLPQGQASLNMEPGMLLWEGVVRLRNAVPGWRNVAWEFRNLARRQHLDERKALEWIYKLFIHCPPPPPQTPSLCHIEISIFHYLFFFPPTFLLPEFASRPLTSLLPTPPPALFLKYCLTTFSTLPTSCFASRI